MPSDSIILVSHGFQVNYERGFCNGLAAAGTSATLISSDRTDVAHLNAKIHPLNLRGSQEENRPRWRKALNLLSYHLRLMALVLIKPRVTVHVIGLIDPVILCGLIQGLWFRMWARRYILTIHDLLPHGRHTPQMLKLHRWAYQLPHHIIVHTQRMRDRLIQEFGRDAATITVMEHGIEPLEADLPIKPSALTEHRDIPQLLFFGRVARYKGIDILLEALQQINTPLRLYVCGKSVDGTLTQELQAAMARLPSHIQASWRDEYVPEEDIAGVFQASDVLVLPYRHIDQSGVLFQALRFGVPVIATDVGEFGRYIDASVGEVCRPNEVSALVEAIERFLAQRHTYDRSVIAARAVQYEWPRVVGPLIQVYQS